MIEIIAGVLAGTGWLLGIPLRRWTKDEIIEFAKKVNLNLFGATVISIVFASLLAYQFSEANSIIIFAGSLFFSSIYTKKPKHQIMFFLIHCAVFLIAFYLAQVFLS